MSEELSKSLVLLLHALAIGGILGIEREYRQKEAGFRTISLVTVGSALLTIVSVRIGLPASPDRIAANIVTGMGFLGAGVIFREGNIVRGITTAATVWVAAAVGLTAGAGYVFLAWIGLAIMLTILQIFEMIEEKVFARKRIYAISLGNNTVDQVEEALKAAGLAFRKSKLSKQGSGKVVELSAIGRDKSYEQFEQTLDAMSGLTYECSY